MLVTSAFETQLRWGKVGETAIANWFRLLGYAVLPVYDVPLDSGKSPRLYTSYRGGRGELVAPDMLTMKGTFIQWVEAKRKTRFSWRRSGINAQHWQTGIDLRHYQHYLHVRDVSKLPLWILFLHVDATPFENDLKCGCPPKCPTGLFGREILALKKAVAHEDRFQQDGRMRPMVYWNIEALKELATLEQVLTASREKAA